MTLPVIAASLLLNSIEPADVDLALDSRRLPDQGAPNVISRVEADVNGDSLADAIVLYNYVTTHRGGRSPYYVVAVVSGASGYEVTPTASIGHRGYEVWSELRLHGSDFLVIGTKWLSGDAMCCPSARAEAVLRFEDGKLVQVRGTWNRQDSE